MGIEMPQVSGALEMISLSELLDMVIESNQSRFLAHYAMLPAGMKVYCK